MEDRELAKRPERNRFPHGFMIMIAGENRDRKRGELKTCPEWVWR